jgi:hypothetical protein
MFNQKVNHFWEENPSYLNHSIGAPKVRAEQIHNCGTTVERYTKENKCNSSSTTPFTSRDSPYKSKSNGLPLQTWCEPWAAVESFAMRPIVNSKEYFEQIKEYLGKVVMGDRPSLVASKLNQETYQIFEQNGFEPNSSLIQTLELEVTNRINVLMANTCDGISNYKNYNPIREGFVVSDIEIDTYRSTTNPNHYYHQVMFSAMNTTRYNTVSFKGVFYQDATPMMSQWDRAIKQVQQSEDVSKNDTNGIVYIANVELLNDSTCVLGQENDCEYTGYNLNGSFAQLLNDNRLQNPEHVTWLNPDSLANNTYDTNGNYDIDGKIMITDNGPSNFNQLLQQFGYA